MAVGVIMTRTKEILLTVVVLLFFLVYSYMLVSNSTKPEMQITKALINSYSIPVIVEHPYFSPGLASEDRLVKLVDSSKISLYIAAYSFTSKRIIDSVINAHVRKVKIGVILDKSHLRVRDGAAAKFKAAGISVLIDCKHAIQHNKFMVVDNKITETGSYNYTKAANESNAENFLIIESAELSELYHSNWKLHKDHSVAY